MAGVARENVSRILTDFERRRLVTKLGRSFQIEVKAKLECENRLLAGPDRNDQGRLNTLIINVWLLRFCKLASDPR
jgi:hypothetical protein